MSSKEQDAVDQAWQTGLQPTAERNSAVDETTMEAERRDLNTGNTGIVGPVHALVPIENAPETSTNEWNDNGWRQQRELPSFFIATAPAMPPTELPVETSSPAFPESLLSPDASIIHNEASSAGNVAINVLTDSMTDLVSLEDSVMVSSVSADQVDASAAPAVEPLSHELLNELAQSYYVDNTETVCEAREDVTDDSSAVVTDSAVVDDKLTANARAAQDGQAVPDISSYFTDPTAVSSQALTGDANARDFFDLIAPIPATSTLAKEVHEEIVPSDQTETTAVEYDDGESKISPSITALPPGHEFGQTVTSQSTVPREKTHSLSSVDGISLSLASATISPQTSEDFNGHSPPLSASGVSLSPPLSHVMHGDDAFSANVIPKQSDLHGDAWLPSDRTLSCLVSMVTSSPGTYFPELDQLTKPGILIEDSLDDPVTELVSKYFGSDAATKRMREIGEKTYREHTKLEQLIESGNYRASVNMTGQMLTHLGQGYGSKGHVTKHTPYSLQLWFIRFSLLVRLKMFSSVEAEIEAFGDFDNPDMYYEFYPDEFKGRRGSMVPFSLRLLTIELLMFLGQPAEAVDNLYAMLAIIQKMLGNLEKGLCEDGSMLHISESDIQEALEIWRSREIRVLFSIANSLLMLKSYSQVYSVLEDIVKLDAKNSAALWSAIGRLHLQIGDISKAEKCMQTAEELSNKNNSQHLLRNIFNRGFVSLSKGLYEEAHTHFRGALDMEPNNAVAINNTAVCLLYMGQLKGALTLLEELVHRDPARYLHTGIVFNLCTMYELESSRAIQKKSVLLELVSKNKGDGFPVSSIKLT